MGNVFSPKHKWRKTVHDTTIQENVKKTKQTNKKNLMFKFKQRGERYIHWKL